MTRTDENRDGPRAGPGTSFALDLLGPFQARVDGSALPPLRSRKGPWLLALLALRAPREVRRDWLAETLWPDSDLAPALASLRQSLADLRRALGGAAARLRAPTARTLALDMDGAAFDVRAFDQAIARASQGQPRADPAALQAAVALYRGPLLEGCAEVWVLPERERRELAYLRALEQLGELSLAEGDPVGAAAWLRRAAAVDPLRQSLHRQLMQAQAAAGDYQAAVETYQGLRRRLHHEFNASPDPETGALYEQLREEGRAKATVGRVGAWGSGTTGRPGPPLSRTPDSGRLPHPLTPLIGREGLEAAIGALLPTARLVTLTGVGGVGKTRLAIEVARSAAAEFRDGAVFVDLAPLRDPALVAATAARALGLQQSDRRREEGAGLAALLESLRSRETLLVLDNCEHLLAASAQLARALLDHCPGLRLLATSRQRLGLPGEVVRQVPPLELPEDRGDTTDHRSPRGHPTTEGPVRTVVGCPLGDRWSVVVTPAIRLFVERAAAVQPEFRLTEENAATVARVCRRLDGLPLAIELAAALVEALPVEAIDARLADRFDLLVAGESGRPERQQTLRAAIDWSYGLLTDPERALLARLSVFAGGFTLEAAEAVAGPGDHAGPRRTTISPTPGAAAVPGLLVSLVRNSLVTVDSPAPRSADPRYPFPGTRYRLLETIRESAGIRLGEAGQEERARRRHLEYFLQLAERAEPELTGAEQTAWLARLDGERDNLRAALEFSLAARPATADGFPERSGSGLRLAAALGRYWHVRGDFAEGRRWLRSIAEGGLRTADCPDGSDPVPQSAIRNPPSAIAKALGWAGFLAVFQGEYAEAERLLRESLARFEAMGDAAGVAGALGSLGVAAKDRGDAAAARQLFEESLQRWRAVGERAGIASTLGYLGILAADRGEAGAAHALFEESLALRRAGGDRWGIAAALNNLGLLALDHGELTRARPLLAESLRIRRELGDRRSTAVTLNHLGRLAAAAGELGAARDCYQESLALAGEIGDRRSVAYSIEAFARLAASGGRWEQVARLSGAAAALRAAIGAPRSATDRAGHERIVAEARAALSPTAFAAAWAEGEAAPLERVMAEALAVRPD